VKRLTLLLMIGGALVLSWIPFLHWPFQWLQTYYHEISHGLAALLTTGDIARIELNFDGSGVCYTRGGSRFLTLLSGYLGAVFWGVLIYSASTIRSALAYQGVMLITGALWLITLVLWARDGVTIGILLVLLALVFLQWRLKSIQLARWVFQFLGVYVLIDALKSPLYLIDSRHRGDGAMLNDLTGIPEMVWVVIWFGAAATGLYFTWKSTARSNRS